MDEPEIIYLISGKRKSGKDFLADKLQGKSSTFNLKRHMKKRLAFRFSGPSIKS